MGNTLKPGIYTHEIHGRGRGYMLQVRLSYAKVAGLA